MVFITLPYENVIGPRIRQHKGVSGRKVPLVKWGVFRDEGDLEGTAIIRNSEQLNEERGEVK